MNEIDSEPLRKETQIDIENVVYHLFQAYPNVNYIALNPGLKMATADSWEDHWYFVGFDEEPVYRNLDGAPAWVAHDDIKFSEEEWGLFYLHVSSKNHYYRGEKIQTSRYDFASPRFFCWHRLSDGQVEQIISDELIEQELTDEDLEVAKTEVMTDFIMPLEEFLKNGFNNKPGSNNKNSL